MRFFERIYMFRCFGESHVEPQLSTVHLWNAVQFIVSDHDWCWRRDAGSLGCRSWLQWFSPGGNVALPEGAFWLLVAGQLWGSYEAVSADPPDLLVNLTQCAPNNFKCFCVWSCLVMSVLDYLLTCVDIVWELCMQSSLARSSDYWNPWSKVTLIMGLRHLVPYSTLRIAPVIQRT